MGEFLYSVLKTSHPLMLVLELEQSKSLMKIFRILAQILVSILYYHNSH